MWWQWTLSWLSVTDPDGGRQISVSPLCSPPPTPQLTTPTRPGWRGRCGRSGWTSRRTCSPSQQELSHSRFHLEILQTKMCYIRGQRIFQLRFVSSSRWRLVHQLVGFTPVQRKCNWLLKPFWADKPQQQSYCNWCNFVDSTFFS